MIKYQKLFQKEIFPLEYEAEKTLWLFLVGLV